MLNDPAYIPYFCQTINFRRRKRRMTAVRERIPDDTCRVSHQRASRLFLDCSINPADGQLARLRYSTYGPLHFPTDGENENEHFQNQDKSIHRASSAPTGNLVTKNYESYSKLDLDNFVLLPSD